MIWKNDLENFNDLEKYDTSRFYTTQKFSTYLACFCMGPFAKITTSDVEELALHLEETQNFRILVDAFGLNMNIFSDEKGSTFENQKEGQRSAYESTIIPQAESWLEKLSKSILTEQDIKSGLRLWPDFTHLPCLQANQKEKAEADDKKASAFKKTAEGIEKLRALNLIDESQARDLLDL